MQKIIISLLLFSSFLGFSQEDAWVYFNVKNNTQTYYDNPLQMLSQRALDRRTKQNIPLDAKDIPIDKSFISQIKTAPGIIVMAQSKWLNALHIRGSVADIKSLKSFAFVEKVDFANKSLNSTGRKAQTSKLNEVLKVLETKVDFAYGNSSNQIQMLNGHLLHQQNFTGSGKVMAIMDAGFPGVDTALPFKRIKDNNQLLGGYDFVNRSDSFYNGNSHGTLVLSSIAGYKENELVGTAPDASFYLFITEDSASENPVEESYWVEAAERADSLGVDVINTSLGYFSYDNAAYSHTYSEMDGKTAFITRGAEVACSRGMIVVASAGNEGATSNPHIATPADGISILTVGAVNASEIVTSFSSIGPSFDNRVKPDVMAKGQAVVLSNPSGAIVTANGTSFSSPIMAGMVACLWQAFPDKTNKEIQEIVVKNADRFLSSTPQYGYGIPDFNSALTNGLGLEEVSNTNLFVYPNPSNDVVKVSFPEGSEWITIRVFDILGRIHLDQVISKSSPNFSIHTLQSGIYIYELESNGRKKFGKLIKS